MTIAIAAIAVLIFIIFCFLCEHNCGTKTPCVNVLARMVARHIVLGFKLFIGFCWFVVGIATLVGMSQPVKPGTQGGRESEQLAGIVNRVTYFPQLVIEGFLLFLQVVTIGLLFGIAAIKDSVVAHPFVYAITAIVIYLIWLAYNVHTVVFEEFDGGHLCVSPDDDPNVVTHADVTTTYICAYGNRCTSTKKPVPRVTIMTWSVLNFVLCIVVLATTGAWVSAHTLPVPDRTVVVVNGIPQGIQVTNCDINQWPDATYTIERRNGAGEPSASGEYVRFYSSSFLGVGAHPVTTCLVQK